MRGLRLGPSAATPQQRRADHTQQGHRRRLRNRVDDANLQVIQQDGLAGLAMIQRDPQGHVVQGVIGGNWGQRKRRDKPAWDKE